MARERRPAVPRAMFFDPGAGMLNVCGEPGCDSFLDSITASVCEGTRRRSCSRRVCDSCAAKTGKARRQCSRCAGPRA